MSCVANSSNVIVSVSITLISISVLRCLLLEKLLRYMHKDKLVTKIWYDESNRTVHIENFTDDLIICAFGINENPTYEDFEAFSEYRCMPKTRFDLKYVLNKLDIPFWEPWILIRYNHGLMYNDYNWIMFEDEEVNYNDIKIRD